MGDQPVVYQAQPMEEAIFVFLSFLWCKIKQYFFVVLNKTIYSLAKILVGNEMIIAQFDVTYLVSYLHVISNIMKDNKQTEVSFPMKGNLIPVYCTCTVSSHPKRFAQVRARVRRDGSVHAWPVLYMCS